MHRRPKAADVITLTKAKSMHAGLCDAVAAASPGMLFGGADVRVGRVTPQIRPSGFHGSPPTGSSDAQVNVGLAVRLCSAS